MLDPDWAVISGNPELVLVLDAYAVQPPPSSEADSDAQVWVPRVGAVEGVSGEKLSQIHGRLIALGMISHRIGDRGREVEYRLTSSGRRSLEQASNACAADGPADSDLAVDVYDDGIEADA